VIWISEWLTKTEFRVIKKRAHNIFFSEENTAGMAAATVTAL